MKRMASVFFMLCVPLFLGGHAVRAQEPRPHSDPMGEQFFPPELVMQYQQAIGLNEEQKSLIKAEVQKATARPRSVTNRTFSLATCTSRKPSTCGFGML